MGGLLAAGPITYIHFIDRRDKYKLLLAKERIDAAQAAYRFAEQLSDNIHAEHSKKFPITEGFREWYMSNCLYLIPEVRSALMLAYNKWTWYKDKLQLKGDLLREINGLSDPKKKEPLLTEYQAINTELLNEFHEILKLPTTLAKQIDDYYAADKCKKFSWIKSFRNN